MLPLTSSTLGFLAAMARFPHVQRRAQAELDRVLGSRAARLPALADRPALPYLAALVLEVVAPLALVVLGNYLRK